MKKMAHYINIKSHFPECVMRDIFSNCHNQFASYYFKVLEDQHNASARN